MPDWFETYVGLEQATSLIRTYELQFVPGLFQTEDYARAVTGLGHRSSPAVEIERRVQPPAPAAADPDQDGLAAEGMGGNRRVRTATAARRP